jgi:hypothetical protein
VKLPAVVNWQEEHLDVCSRIEGVWPLKGDPARSQGPPEEGAMEALCVG